MGMGLMRAALCRHPPPHADQYVECGRQSAVAALVGDPLVANCTVAIKAVYLPHELNQLDAAMMSASCAHSVRVLRTLHLRWTDAETRLAVGAEYWPTGRMPGAGVVNAPGRVVAGEYPVEGPPTVSVAY